MARAQCADETEGFPRRIKLGFDRRVVEEYVLAFRDSRRREGGRPLPEDKVWADLVDVLAIDGATRWRYLTGNDGTGNRPLSPFDGRPERYRPGLAEVFRHIAALDIAVGDIGFPRGRVIVNRAVARALTGLRRMTTGEDRAITADEVERLRFLERWNRSHRVTSGFSAQTVRDMSASDPGGLTGEIDPSDQFISRLNQLYADWAVHFTRLLGILSYDWLRC
jgi:hypothetical protein